MQLSNKNDFNVSHNAFPNGKPFLFFHFDNADFGHTLMTIVSQISILFFHFIEDCFINVEKLYIVVAMCVCAFVCFFFVWWKSTFIIHSGSLLQRTPWSRTHVFYYEKLSHITHECIIAFLDVESCIDISPFCYSHHSSKFNSHGAYVYLQSSEQE